MLYKSVQSSISFFFRQAV